MTKQLGWRTKLFGTLDCVTNPLLTTDARFL